MSKTNNPAPQPENNAVRLDDESRVKVLSPGMLVFRRFVRNRLAIIGAIIIIIMFLFSFLGAVFMPYSQSQVFRTYDVMNKDYASVMINEELRYVIDENESFSLGARAQFILALNNDEKTFTSDGTQYTWAPLGEDAYEIMTSRVLFTALDLKGKYAYASPSGAEIDGDVTKAFEAAQQANDGQFTANGALYTIAKAGKSFEISESNEIGLASMRVFDVYDAQNAALIAGYPFRSAVEHAIAQNLDSFEADGVAYTMTGEDGNVTVSKENEPFAIVTRLIAQPASSDIAITVAFKDAALEAIEANERSFVFVENGEETEYFISRTHNTYTIKRETVTELIDMYAAPSAEHWLGTDGNGMDVLTRLMYGGRISLMVGFIVVLIELLIGVIIGGVAGYFGGWVDTVLMRFIDLFNCIPYYPVMIIVGAVMDVYEVDPYIRIFILMAILGLLGWTGIARIVRGQILSLREQDFMVATEATGIRVSRRIFRHLVPNVMPLLIVHATLNLGSVIITEATLSFLGLGLKYPMASWGTIINAATNIYVMTNYWFIWIPAGMLILLTVLGFNFIGDGLRDAFDPKMKR